MKFPVGFIKMGKQSDKVHGPTCSMPGKRVRVEGEKGGRGLLSFIAPKLKLAQFPENRNFKQLLSIGNLGGVGFTVSLFIANLAFENQTCIDASKTGILIGSLIAGLLGYLL